MIKILNKLSETVKASYTDVTSGYYAPILKFPKYNGVDIDDNGCFTIDVCSVGKYDYKKSELFISVYNNGGVNTIKAKYLNYSDVDCQINLEGNYYVLYVKAMDDQSKVIANLITSHCLGFHIPIEFKRFTVVKSSLTSLVTIEPKKIGNKLSNNYLIPSSSSSAQYFVKVARIGIMNNSTGMSLSGYIEESFNNYDTNFAGSFNLKLTKDGSGFLKAKIKTVSGSSDFNSTFCNIIIYQINTTTYDIYFAITRSWTPFIFTPLSFNTTQSGTSIIFYDNNTIETQPAYTEVVRLFTT